MEGMILYGCATLYNLLLLLFVARAAHAWGAVEARPRPDAGLLLASAGLVALPLYAWAAGLLDGGTLSAPAIPTALSVGAVLLVAALCVVRRRRGGRA